LLEKYNEPSWNFPVVRFLNGKGQDILPRRDRQYQISQLLPRMNKALAQAGAQSDILPLIQPETVRPSLIALSQHCFWTGELAIGGIEGVVKTEAGWLKGKEVTLVYFDKEAISEDQIVQQAKAQSCANDVFRGADLKGYRPARESDQKRQLQGTRFDKIKSLTAFQKTKLNAYARTNPTKAKTYLTPRQRKLVSR
jgi:hypothetical protein